MLLSDLHIDVHILVAVSGITIFTLALILHLCLLFNAGSSNSFRRRKTIDYIGYGKTKTLRKHPRPDDFSVNPAKRTRLRGGKSKKYKNVVTSAPVAAEKMKLDLPCLR